MTIRNTYAAETWDAVYKAYGQVNFTSFDYDTVKESLIQYLKIYFPEHFNDFIESSELIAMAEIFAYVSDLLAYRIDFNSHENFITTAQRKQAVLKLARLVSYVASRNIPARGLVKINSISTTEEVYDSLGNNLAGVTVNWNDANNSNWKEQFYLVMDKVLTSKVGQPQKSFQIDDVAMQLYSFKNLTSSFRNGVFSYTASGSGQSFGMEIVPADLDENGPFERAPDPTSNMSIIYATDGRGDGSDYTGFLMFTKQGALIKTEYTMPEAVANRRVKLDLTDVNDTDIWVYQLDSNGDIGTVWKQVETIDEENLYFNNITTTTAKYEVETQENDQVTFLFGDGNFSDMPVGTFQFWVRVSANSNAVVQKNSVVGQAMSFSYTSGSSTTYSASLSFSLTTSLQNGSSSEDIEHVRQTAPTTYYSQNRMVNGQDHNTYMLKDSTIVRVKAINRTFAGQPKYIEWNDASNRYQNVKLFGDDLKLYYDVGINSVESTASSRAIIDSVVEPLLQDTGLFTALTHVSTTYPYGYGIISQPRRKFIEDNRPLFYDGLTGEKVNPYGPGTSSSLNVGSLNEKTAIQAALDRHYYGEPIELVAINGVTHAKIYDPALYPADDGKIYQDAIPRTIDGVTTYPPGDAGSGIQPIASQPFFGLRFNRFLRCFGSTDIELHTDTAPIGLGTYRNKLEVFTIEVLSDGATLSVTSNLRGRLADSVIGTRYSTLVDTPPFDFTVPTPTTSASAFEQGDAFVVELYDGIYVGQAYWDPTTTPNWIAKVRAFGSDTDAPTRINLNGWWQIIPGTYLTAGGIDPSDAPFKGRSMYFDPYNEAASPNDHNDPLADSWLLLVKRTDSAQTGDPLYFDVYWRDVELTVESPTTNFWYNETQQIIDPDTKLAVSDKLRVLRSNLDSTGRPLIYNHDYDIVGPVYDDNGDFVSNKLRVLPSKSSSLSLDGEQQINNLLQFEEMTVDSYEFVVIAPDNTVTSLGADDYTYTGGSYNNVTSSYDDGVLVVSASTLPTMTFTFTSGSYFAELSNGYTATRRRVAPGVQSGVDGLDFMWQHFCPDTNLIDPSPTNIHDVFLITRGYYSDMLDYVKGNTDVEPAAPTPFTLRNSYGYLLENKMLSDTIVLHSGKFKLLFGSLAATQLRAKFRVVKLSTATYSDERIKTEIISVIETYFDIANWDFGMKFYATDLISLIHQRLATQIASVVLVPVYSNNSFGSLFTIDSAFDEILQSAATVDDVQIVDALTPTVLRQYK